jgi:hypothetical protein
VFLQQYEPHEDKPRRVCRVYNMKKRRWLAPKRGCLDGEFSDVYAAHYFPGEQLVLYSAGEGHPGVTVTPFNLERGQQSEDLPTLDLYPSGPMEAYPRTGGGVFFTSPCRLEQPAKRPCEGTREGDPWYLYLWSDGRMTRLTQIRSSTVPDPSGSRLAWLDERGLCLKGLRDSTEPEACYRIP